MIIAVIVIVLIGWGIYLAIVYWYISVPSIFIFFLVLSLIINKKNHKTHSKLQSKRKKQKYFLPQPEYYKSIPRLQEKQCSYCNASLELINDDFCPFCGSRINN